MRFYRFLTFDEAVATGKITREDLQKAIDEGKVKFRTHYSPVRQDFITEEELHRVLGLDFGFEPK